MKSIKLIFPALLLLLLGVAVRAQDPAPPVPPDPVVADEDEVGTRLFKMIDPTVVAIMHERAGGSGVIISADGYILTNGHVVSAGDSEDPKRTARKITVILSDERKYPATVIGHCLDPDCALIKIEPDDPLTPARLANSDLVRTGQRTYAMGMPTGLKRSLTSGIVSNSERTDLGTYTKVIQTDAAINPGNSGGPLFNEKGEVLGLNTYASRNTNNLGFTIPINVVKLCTEHYRKWGYFKRAAFPYFVMQEIYEEFGKALGVEKGIFVDFVLPQTPAAKAGLQTGDVIVEMNGEPAAARTRAEMKDFNWKYVTQEIGSEITFKIRRKKDGEWTDLTVSGILEEDEPAPANGYQRGEIEEHRWVGLGLGVRRLVRHARVIHALPFVKGVWVSRAGRGSATARAGIRRNDLIVSVEGVKTPDVAALKLELDKHLTATKKAIRLTLRRGNSTIKTAIAPDYDLKGKRVALIVPDNDHQWVAASVRWLTVDGAELTLATPAGGDVETDAGTFAARAIEGLKAADFDCILLAGGDGAQDFWTDPVLAALLKDALKAKKVVAAVGAASIALLEADPGYLEKKITTAEEFAEEANSRNANYTGKSLEKDGKIITTTGFDKAAIRAFLKAVRDIVRKG